MITLSGARSRVRADLGLRDSSLLQDADLTDWLQEASDLVATETLWFRTTETMGTTAGTKEYALPTPAAARCIQIEEIHYDNRPLCPVTLEQLLQLDPYYRRAGNGTPDYYYARGGGGFGLHYTPSVTDVDILLVTLVAKPPLVTADTETFYIPHGLERGLLIYAKKLASEKDIFGEGARRAALYDQQWREFMLMAKKQVGATSERSTPVMGETALYDSRWRSPYRKVDPP